MFEQMLVGLQSSPTSAASAPILRSVAVIGAGPLGQALACAALAAGCEATIQSPFRSEATRLTDVEHLTVTGPVLSGTFRLAHSGSADRGKEPAIRVDLGFDAAVAAADVIVLAVPASAHSTYAGMLAPVLRSGQLVVLAPGGCFGALEVTRALRRNRCRVEVTVVELATAPYLVSESKPGHLEVLAELRSIPAAALPNAATASAVGALASVFPGVRAAAGVLETAFSDMAGMLIAAPALLAASAPGPASVRERLPDAVVESVLVALDDERRRVASAYGVRGQPSLREWLENAFGVEADDVVSALDQVPAFRSLRCPGADDVAVHDATACTLVPIASAAAAVGVATPATFALIGLASALGGIDHARHGRSLAALGLDGLSSDDIRRMLHATERAAVRETTL